MGKEQVKKLRLLGNKRNVKSPRSLSAAEVRSLSAVEVRSLSAVEVLGVKRTYLVKVRFGDYERVEKLLIIR